MYVSPGLNQEATTIRMKRTMDEDANGVGNKKLRNDVEEAPPSRVVHIRSVPLGVVETDIALLAVPFGFMTNMLLAKKKSQALINMQSLDVASEMVDYYSQYPPIMNGKKLIVQFSTHQELVTEQENQACQRAIRAAAEQTQHLLSDTESFNHRTLRILIENCISNITLTILFKVFSRYGMIEKLLVFKKNANYQALLQYENPLEARVAKVMLNDKNIYDEGCTLRIAYSKQRELDIRTDGPSSRDFTRKPMTDREMRELDRPNPNPGILGGSGSAAAVAAAAAAMKAASGPGNMSMGPGGLSGPAPSGPGMRGMPPSPGMGIPSGMGGTGPSLTGPRPGLQGGFSTAAGSITNMLGIPQQQMMAAAAAATAAGLSPVVMVSNMNEQQMTPDKLFTLFGVFGDVIRVKQLYNKRDCALVQFTDPLGANRAIEFLNGIRLYNNVLRVTRSKHMRIQMPREEVDEGYTRDYSDSRLHRFKKPGSKNLQNIFPPSEHLHLSNLPENMTEEEIQEFFERFGFPLVGIRFIAKGHKMALVRLKTVEDACEALISLHDTELDANHHLRVSFTAAVI